MSGAKFYLLLQIKRILLLKEESATFITGRIRSRKPGVLAGMDPVDAILSFDDLKVIGSFCGFIDEFLLKILDMFHLDYSTLTAENCQPLYNKLGIPLTRI